MSDHNPLDIIGRHFPVEFMNPNPKMTPLSSGDRYTLTVEVHKELFDLFCEVGRDGRAGMIIDGMLMVSERPRPVGYEDEGEPDIGITMSEEKPAKIDHTNSRLAAMYCKNENFQKFLAINMFANCDPAQVTEDTAKLEIILCCGIDSRADLDTNRLARETFIKHFCKPYTAYMQSREGK
ncbi:MAG: hypothetical protein JKY81_04730 [Colwellia sp.]|nr:hypothetical protein [Colwellia sp.]